jgi:hypothetical protein
VCCVSDGAGRPSFLLAGSFLPERHGLQPLVSRERRTRSRPCLGIAWLLSKIRHPRDLVGLCVFHCRTAKWSGVIHAGRNLPALHGSSQGEGTLHSGRSEGPRGFSHVVCTDELGRRGLSRYLGGLVGKRADGGIRPFRIAVTRARIRLCRKRVSEKGVGKRGQAPDGRRERHGDCHLSDGASPLFRQSLVLSPG